MCFPRTAQTGSGDRGQALASAAEAANRSLVVEIRCLNHTGFGCGRIVQYWTGSVASNNLLPTFQSCHGAVITRETSLEWAEAGMVAPWCRGLCLLLAVGAGGKVPPDPPPRPAPDPVRQVLGGRPVRRQPAVPHGEAAGAAEHAVQVTSECKCQEGHHAWNSGCIASKGHLAQCNVRLWQHIDTPVFRRKSNVGRPTVCSGACPWGAGRRASGASARRTHASKTESAWPPRGITSSSSYRGTSTDRQIHTLLMMASTTMELV
jgi:hypothetical protein